MVQKKSKIRLGDLSLECPVLLAPMSGVSDLPFRRLAHEMGAPFVVSEMVASAEFVRGREDVQKRALGREISPFVIQLVGHDPYWMAEAARMSVDLGADVIDINMGCPAREVTGKQSGSALMQELPLATEIVQSIIGAVSVPVTLKMRLGWDRGSLNAPELASIAEKSGIQMLTVHGRTRCDFFKGHADWGAVRPVCDAVTIPVIVNGDIASFEDMSRAMELSEADGVMIGRGAYGAPWLPARLREHWMTGVDPGCPALTMVRRIALDHVQEMLSHYGVFHGLRNARKHIGWYLEHGLLSPEETKAWRRRLCTSDEPSDVLRGLGEFFAVSSDRAGVLA